MAAATLQILSWGRGPDIFPDLAGVYCTITASATTYTTATGGLPIDLTGILQQAAPAGWDAPYGIQALNPADVVGVLAMAMSTNGFLPGNLAVGTPTYTAVPWQADSGQSATPGFLATCPATIRLWGTGASNAAAFAEFANGANSDVFSVIIVINRSGANN